MTTEFVLRCSRTGASLPKGIEVTTFRGEKATLVDYWTEGGRSTGRVLLRFEDGTEQAYYPAVIHARICEA